MPTDPDVLVEAFASCSIESQIEATTPPSRLPSETPTLFAPVRDRLVHRVLDPALALAVEPVLGREESHQFDALRRVE